MIRPIIYVALFSEDFLANVACIMMECFGCGYKSWGMLQCMVGNILYRFRVFDVRDWFKYLFTWTWSIELEGFIQIRASQFIWCVGLMLCCSMTFKDS